MSLITSVGPLAIPALWKPTTMQAAGPQLPSGGEPISGSFVLELKSDAERLKRMVTNAARKANHLGAYGVLEWVQADGALDAYRGWWVFHDATIGYEGSTLRTSTYFTVSVTATFFGPNRPPVIVGTHQDRPDDFSLVGSPIVAPVFPYEDNSAPNQFNRNTVEGITTSGNTTASKRQRVVTSFDSFRIDRTDLRPSIHDMVAGVTHYGPFSSDPINDEVRLQTATFRARLFDVFAPKAFWIAEAFLSGRWTRIGTIHIPPDTDTAGGQQIVSKRFRDDEVAVLMVGRAGGRVRATARQYDLGIRILPDEASQLEVRPVLGGSAGITYAAGKYGNGAYIVDSGDHIYYLLHREFEGQRPFTICGWYKPDATTDAAQRTIMQLRSSTAGDQKAAQLYMQASSARVRVFRKAGVPEVSLDSGIDVAAATLTFFAARYDGANLKVSVKTGAGALTHASVASALAPTTIDTLDVGFVTGPTEQAKGVVDNVMVFSRSLSDTELAAIANGSANDAGVDATTALDLALWATLDDRLDYSPPTTLAGNYYLEAQPSGLGIKRFIALVKTAAGTDLPNWRVTVGVGKEAFFGFEPASPQSADTAAEQGKQLLYARSQLLTLDG